MGEPPTEIRGHLTRTGRLAGIPRKRDVQLRVLEWLAGAFESGRTYNEREVNERLRKWHTFDDPARLRRDLVDAGFLRRDDGKNYRRA